jgi:hypothetical protein
MEVSNAPGVEGILVGIRMRPLNDKEVAAGQDKAFKCMNTYNAVTQLTKDGHPVEGQMYYYDKVFDERSNTGDVYSHIGKDVVKGVVNGINGTIFACEFPPELCKPTPGLTSDLPTHLLSTACRWPNVEWQDTHHAGQPKGRAGRAGDGCRGHFYPHLQHGWEGLSASRELC